MNWTEDDLTEYYRRTGKTQPTPAKKPKYNNHKVRIDGLLFDSQLEADYYADLKLQLKAGVIRGYCRQPEFVLTEGMPEYNIEPMSYKADFIIFHLDGTAEIIDTKGFLTDIYKNKRKVFYEKYPKLEIKEVTHET
jgi:hypothetical protein